MNRRLGAVVGVAIIASACLGGCAARLPITDGSRTPSAPPATSASATSASASEPTCDVLAWIGWREDDDGAGVKQVAIRAPFDSGTREGAAGTAHLGADGRVVAYTVAAGDAPSVIEDRFCIDGISVLHFNGYWVAGDGKDIAPGDYLYLVPDPHVTYSGPDL